MEPPTSKAMPASSKSKGSRENHASFILREFQCFDTEKLGIFGRFPNP
jgi:hypothetical protein